MLKGRRAYITAAFMAVLGGLLLTNSAGCLFDRSGINAGQNNNNQAVCGDGLVEGSETCDDANTEPGDGCSADCQQEAGWVCTGEPSVCLQTCGNGLIDQGEECDDGNIAEGDGCSASCAEEPGWVCGGEPSVCVQSCGNGVVETGEGCDDGNIIDGDGCSANCSVEPGYTCTGEPSMCLATCGNGVITGNEECDDGNLTAGDGCSNFCQVELGWECNQDEPSVCWPECGDGMIIAGPPPEACDDGNLVNGDGCSDACTVEDHTACSGEPSVCVCVVYVNLISTSAQPDGSSWPDAYTTVQEGISTAAPLAPARGGGCDVWVAQGTYNIYVSSDADTVTLANLVGVYGGFTGSETARDQRNWLSNFTVLDGAHGTVPTNRVVHVVSAASTTDATLDGFTVTRGYVPSGDVDGAGIFLTDSFVTVANCRVRENENADDGSGIYSQGGSLTLLDSEILLNWSRDDGGGVTVRGVGSTAVIKRCFFRENTGGDRGGGLTVHEGVVTVENSVFWLNTSNRGGGASIGTQATLAFTNCTFYGNQSGSGTNGGGIHNDSSAVNVANTIIWSNLPGSFSNAGGATTAIRYSDVEGPSVVIGQGNINQDPAFVNPSGGVFHLSSLSPCIDAGDATPAPLQDMEYNFRVDDPGTSDTGAGVPPVDMGAYEFQP